MKYIFLATLAVILSMVGCSKQPNQESSSEYPHIIFWENQYRNGDSLWNVSYGTCYENSIEELTFVLFDSGSLDNPPDSRRVITREIDHRDVGKNIKKQEGYLIGEKGEMIQLPTETQLYEIVNGKLSSRPERVSITQIKGYLESEPDEYTLKSLLDYAAGN